MYLYLTEVRKESAKLLVSEVEAPAGDSQLLLHFLCCRYATKGGRFLYLPCMHTKYGRAYDTECGHYYVTKSHKFLTTLINGLYGGKRGGEQRKKKMHELTKEWTGAHTPELMITAGHRTKSSRY